MKAKKSTCCLIRKMQSLDSDPKTHLGMASEQVADIPAVLPKRGAFSKQQHEDASDSSLSQSNSGNHIDDDYYVMSAKQKVCRGIWYEIPDSVSQHISLHSTSHIQCHAHKVAV